MNALCSESLRLRTCRTFRPLATWTVVARAIRSSTALVAVTVASPTAPTSLAAVIAPAPVTASSAISVSAAAASTASTSIAITAASTASITIAITAPALAGELGRHPTLVLGGPHKAERFAALALLFRRKHTGDEHTIDGELCVDTHHITDAGPLVEEIAIKLTLWLLCAGSTPGVAAVITFAG